MNEGAVGRDILQPLPSMSTQASATKSSLKLPPPRASPWTSIPHLWGHVATPLSRVLDSRIGLIREEVLKKKSTPGKTACPLPSTRPSRATEMLDNAGSGELKGGLFPFRVRKKCSLDSVGGGELVAGGLATHEPVGAKGRRTCERLVGGKQLVGAQGVGPPTLGRDSSQQA